MKKILLSLMALSLVFVSCDDEDDASFGTLSLSISGLVDLGDDYVYEGWIVVDGSPVTTGVFTVDADGMMSQTSFEIDEEMLESATTFVLSIEPANDSDPAPSSTKILGGDFSGGSASVSIMHGAAFGTGFGGVTGSYILKTPTTETDEDDLSGVWFLDPADGVASLVDLPDLTDQAGWVYEGWAVIDGVAVSTGRFNMAEGADQSAAFSGPNDGPAFPGEDFVMNAPGDLVFPTDLTDGGKIVISIEPEPDNSAGPFTLKPLFSEVASDLTPGTLQAMDNIAADTYPSGSVSR